MHMTFLLLATDFLQSLPRAIQLSGAFWAPTSVQPSGPFPRLLMFKVFLKARSSESCAISLRPSWVAEVEHITHVLAAEAVALL